MLKTELNKDAFKEFSKLVLYLCNYSKRKVFMGHLKIMLGYYLQKVEYENSKLIEFIINSQGAEIPLFDEYLITMRRIGFVEFDKNFYGTIILAKKKLDNKAYGEYQLKTLEEIVGKSVNELILDQEVLNARNINWPM